MFKRITIAIPPKEYDKEKGCTAKTVGEVLKEMLQSNSNLAKGYRQFLASKSQAEKGGAL